MQMGTPPTNVIPFPQKLADEQPDAIAAYDAFFRLVDDIESHEDEAETKLDEKSSID
jgi:hypothetical protein